MDRPSILANVSAHSRNTLMDFVRRGSCSLVAASCLLAAAPAMAADLIRDVEDAYALRQLPRTRFDPRAVRHLEWREARFLEELFGLTDEVVLLNTDVGRWFASGGTRGLNAADYLEDMSALRVRLGQLETPDRIQSVRRFVAESLTLQSAFVKEWKQALDEGREFESQLTDEFAYHEGLHRSRRVLLKAFAELRALFPDAGEAVHAAFRDHLRAVGLQ